MAYDLNIPHRFTFHPPRTGQPDRYERLRAGGREFAAIARHEQQEG
ncbi:MULTISPECIES: hypothetical protein [unclassified Streptomyces]|nr:MULTISPECIES: hypothetical protein [unclassified Streptomyces]MYR93108.1 hypothetical protein [Streptomyces sp. SID4937]SCD46553.1 hypothetical protein GA0115243_102189 [Streptomyces sp. ScaeMP-e83]